MIAPGKDLLEAEPPLGPFGREIDQEGFVAVAPRGIDHQRQIGRGLNELQHAAPLGQFERRARRGDGGEDGIDLGHCAAAATSLAQR